MALTFPLSAAAFADLLRVDTVNLRPRVAQQLMRPASGSLRSATRGEPYWVAEVTTVPLSHADADGIEALLSAIQSGPNNFLLYDYRKRYPRLDPTGATFGAATPVVGTITNRTVAAFTGFPNGYQISRGDKLQIISDTSRHYLGMFAEDKTANGAGAVSAVSLTPPLPTSVAPGDAVTVVKPAAKFVLVPDSWAPSQVTTNFRRISFQAEQSYDQ